MALASNTAQLYAALVYVTPLGGGYIADRLIGRTATVSIGAIIMVIGTFLLALNATFLLGLLLLLVGVGCFKAQHREPGRRALPHRRSAPRRRLPDLLPRHPARGDHFAVHLRHLGPEGGLASGLRRRGRRHGVWTGDLSRRPPHLSAGAGSRRKAITSSGRRSHRATGRP